MIVFVDDSGDPGFKLLKGSSELFVIALVIFKNEIDAEKTALAIKNLKQSRNISDNFEFKFNKCNKTFRNYFLDTIKSFKFDIRAIIVNKKDVQSNLLRSHKENFHNYIIMRVFKRNSSHIKNAKLKFDERGDSSLRDQLRVYLSHKLDNKNNHVFDSLKFVSSDRNSLIQLADMVAGSIYSYFSGKDRSFLKKLRESKRLEDIWEFK